MKKFFLFLILIVVLIIAVLVGLVMMSFNPTAYEKQVVGTLQRLTGREVSIGAGTAISWSPVPTVVMNDMRLKNMDKGSAQDLMRIEKVQVNMTWSSLLKSPMVIDSIELTKPTILLERLESNRVNFAFPFLIDPNFQLNEIDFMSAGKTGPSDTGTQISSIKIKEGTITYQNAVSGIRWVMQNVNGQLAADSVRGPFRWTGAGVVNNVPYQLNARTGVFQGTNPIAVSLNLKSDMLGLETTLDGTFTPTRLDKWFEASGNFVVAKTNDLMRAVGLPAPWGANDRKVDGNWTVEVTPAENILKNFIVTYDPENPKTALTGTISQKAGTRIQYNITLNTGLWRATDWPAYTKAMNWAWLEKSEDYPDMAFKINADQVVIGGYTLGKTALAGKYEAGILTLDKSEIGLAGDTAVTLTGRGQMMASTPTLDLKFQANTQKPKTLINVLLNREADEETAAIKTSVVGGLTLTPDKITTTIQDLKMGTAAASGSVAFNRGEEKSYQVRVALNEVNLDTLTKWQAPAEKIALEDLPARVKAWLEQASWAQGVAVSGTLDARNGTVFGTPFLKLHMEGNLVGNTLKLDNLTALNLAGTNVSMTGLIKDLGRPQMNVDGWRITLDSKNLPTLLDKMNLACTVPLVQQAKGATAQLNLKGGQDNLWQLDGQFALNDLSAKFSGTLNTVDTEPAVQAMRVDLAYPKFRTLATLINPEYKALPNLDGTFKLRGVITGTRENWEIKDMALNIGLQQLSGVVSFHDGQVKTLTATVSAPALNLDRILPTDNNWYSPINGLSTNPVAFKNLDNQIWDIHLKARQLFYREMALQNVDMALALQNKELALTQLVANAGSGEDAPIRITGKADWNTPEPALTTSFEIKNMPIRADFMVLKDLAIGGGKLTLKGDLKTRGVSPALWGKNLNGKGTLAVQGGQIVGADTDQMIPIVTRAIQRSETQQDFEPEMKRVLHSGKTVIKTIQGDYVVADGVVRMMDLTLKTANVTGNPTQVIWDIPRRTMDISVPVVMNALNTLPPFVLGISVGRGRGIYTPNYADLASVLAGRSKTALADNLKQQQEQAQLAISQKRADRLAEGKNLTKRAREAVAEMEGQLRTYPFETGNRLYQSAKDALSIVNQTAIREEPTDAQLIQQIEQARLVLLKAEEFEQALTQETAFNVQQQIQSDRDQAAQMTTALQQWAGENPDIEVLARLAQNAAQNRAVIEQVAARIGGAGTAGAGADAAQTERLLAASADALAKIKAAYQHAARFDLSEPLASGTQAAVDARLADETEEDAGTVEPAGRTVRGSFSRAR